MSECKHRGLTEVTTDEKGFLCYDCGDAWDALSMLERAEQAEDELKRAEAKVKALEEEAERVDDFVTWSTDWLIGRLNHSMETGEHCQGAKPEDWLIELKRLYRQAKEGEGDE